MEQSDNTLLIGGEKVASWTSLSKIASVSLSFNGTSISFGTQLKEKGTLSLSVQNEAGRSASKNISITDNAILGLSTLKQLMKVDEEVDLLKNLTFVKGVELSKTELEMDGQRTAIAAPTHFTPAYPGLCTLIFTVKKSAYVGEVKVEDVTIKALDYSSLKINHLQPKDILPVVSQVNR